MVSETNSETTVMLSLNDSPKKSPRQYSNFVNRLSENLGDHPSEVIPSVLFPPTVVRNRGFPLLTAHPVIFYEHRCCGGAGLQLPAGLWSQVIEAMKREDSSRSDRDQGEQAQKFS